MTRVITFLATLFFISTLQAEGFSMGYTPQMAIKYRQDFMTAVKAHNQNIKSIVYGSVPHSNHLKIHLSALESMFAEIDTLFPEGSNFGDSYAKDSVWKKPQKFQQYIKDAQQALATFKQIAEQGDNKKTKAAMQYFTSALQIAQNLPC